MDENILSNTNEENYKEEHEVDAITNEEQAIIDESIRENLTLEKAIEMYRKIRVGNDEVTESEQEKIEKECEVIRNREIIDTDEIHDPEEITSDGKIVMGPPKLTRFESARIMGARALQLSLGAPPFITIPKEAATSLDIAIMELDDRLIPITIRRTLPNGDYQNIPITDFKK